MMQVMRNLAASRAACPILDDEQIAAYINRGEVPTGAAYIEVPPTKIQRYDHGAKDQQGTATGGTASDSAELRILTPSGDAAADHVSEQQQGCDGCGLKLDHWSPQ